MNLFDASSPWVKEDNRHLREVSRTTPESLNHRHAAMLPPETLPGKTVLDLGCCIGASGYWVLNHGAAHYTGVEVQEEYARVATALFRTHGASSKYTIHQSDLIGWLESRTRDALLGTRSETWDIVMLAGVLYGFTDPLYILRMASRLARESVVIDMLYPQYQLDPQTAYMEIVPLQRMVLATRIDAVAGGAGSRISPAALEAIMANYGFRTERRSVKPITDTHDSYNGVYVNRAGGRFPLRYITCHTRSQRCAASVNESIVNGETTLVPQAQAPR